MAGSTRDTALERLNLLVGEWSMEASIAPGTVGHASFEWVLDDQFLVQHTVVPGAPESIATISLNSGGETFTQHYFDSRGVVRLYTMTLRDGVWTLLRDSPDFSPLDFCQRFTAEFSADHSTIRGRWEKSDNVGATWDLDFDLTYRR